MVNTEYMNCEICGVQITGYGRNDLMSNYEAHLKQVHNTTLNTHKTLEDVVVEDEKIEYPTDGFIDTTKPKKQTKKKVTKKKK